LSDARNVFRPWNLHRVTGRIATTFWLVILFLCVFFICCCTCVVATHRLKLLRFVFCFYRARVKWFHGTFRLRLGRDGRLFFLCTWDPGQGSWLVGTQTGTTFLHVSIAKFGFRIFYFFFDFRHLKIARVIWGIFKDSLCARTVSILHVSRSICPCQNLSLSALLSGIFSF
jgi:hypothetical protein